MNNLYNINYRPVSFKSFLGDYISDKILREKEGLEIEVRLGKFSNKEKISLSDKQRDISYQGPLLVNSNFQIPQNLTKSSLSYLNKTKYFFNPSISEKTFFGINSTLEKSLGEPVSELTVDFGVSGERYTWIVKSSEFFNTSKINKENLDVLHQGLEYRISTSVESKKKLNPSEILKIFSKEKPNIIRIKARKIYRFQFFSVMITNVFSSSYSDNIKTIVDLIEKEDNEDKATKIISVARNNDFEQIYEIENEIVDNQYLINILKNEGYKSFNLCLDRFFRNSEILYFWNSVKIEEKYTKIGKDLDVFLGKRPVIGDYIFKLLSNE